MKSRYKYTLPRLLGAAALVCTAITNAQQLKPTPFTTPPQDTSGALSNYDVLGVKLGMPEAEAVAAVRKAFPAGAKDGNGYAISLKQADYMLTNPINHRPVRAGVKFLLHGNVPERNFDFVKLLVQDGKVWAVWRDDAASNYDADRFAASIHAKYPEASEIVSFFDVVEGGRRTSDGTTGVIGARLYDGRCEEIPPLTHVTTDSITLANGCRKALVVKYAGIKTAGVKTVHAGESQLVDLDVGRQFFASMKTMAADKAKADNLRGGEAKF